MELLFVPIVVFWMIFFYQVGAWIAEKKGYPRSYGWWAAVFGIFAIVVLAVIPNRSTTVAPAQAVQASPTEDSPGAAKRRIEELQRLKDEGVLTETEYEEKRKEAIEKL